MPVYDPYAKERQKQAEMERKEQERQAKLKRQEEEKAAEKERDRLRDQHESAKNMWY